jgi:hypothetical protein
VGAAVTANPRLAAIAAVVVATTGGCVDEYHPEYHPETSYDFEQRVSYPTTVVQQESPEGALSAGVTQRHLPAVPPPAPAPSPPVSPWAGRWVEHVEGTTCDRSFKIEEIDGVPYASLFACDGLGDEGADGEGPQRLDTVGYEKGIWRVRHDAHASDAHSTFPDVATYDDLDYRLTRTGPDDLCGTLVVRPWNKKRGSVPVCWSRRPANQESPDAVPSWLLGEWRVVSGGNIPDDSVKFEAAGGDVRVYRHGGYTESHFDTRTMKFGGDHDGVLQVIDKTPDGYVLEYRLRRADDGTLRGVLISQPPRSRRREKTREYPGELWVREGQPSR